MTWWQLSDADPSLMRMCECTTLIPAHASRLRCDDNNLKWLPASHGVCSGCDLYNLETIHHIVMQCPDYHDLRLKMYDDIRFLEGEIPQKFKEEPVMVFKWLMSRSIEWGRRLRPA